MKKFENVPAEMKGYYFVIACLSFIVLLVVGANILGNVSRKSDAKLEQELQSQHSLIESYASSKQKLPDTPLDAGINDTNGVEYTKVSKSKYMLCATFKTKSDGNYEAYPHIQPLEAELRANGTQSMAQDTKYVDGNRSINKHDKGYSCLVFEPYALSDERLYPYVTCDKRYKRSDTYLTIEKIDPTAKTMNARSLYSSNDPKNSNLYDISRAEVYDKKCKKIAITDLQVGSTIHTYSNEKGDEEDGYSDEDLSPDLIKVYK